MQKILTLVYFVSIARSFGPAEQGMYSTALSFAALFSVTIDLGVAAVLTREIARDASKAAELISQSVTFRLILGVAMYVVMIGAAYTAGYRQSMLFYISLTGIAMLFDVMSTSCWAVFRGLHNLRYEAWSLIVVTGIMVGGGMLAIYFNLPVAFLLYALLASSVSGFVIVLILLITKGGIHVSLGLDRVVISRLLIMALPFAGVAIFSRIYTNADVTLLERMSGGTAAGWYAAANKIILALQFIPASISASIYPAMSQYFLTDKEKIGRTYARATMYLMLLVIPMAAGLSILARDIVLTFYSQNYIPTIATLQTLSLALVCAFLIFPLGAVMAAVNRQGTNTKIFAVAALINIGMNLYLIPRYQSIGAGIASSCTYLFILVVSMIVMREFWKHEAKYLALSAVKICGATACMILGLVYLEPHAYVFVRIMMGAGIFGVAALAFRVVTIKELLHIRQSL